MEVALSWTAPGGDYQEGSAARYEIRTATKVEYLTLQAVPHCTPAAEQVEYLTGAEFSVKGILVHPSLTPRPGPAGATETGIVRVPWPNEVSMILDLKVWPIS